MGLLLSGSHGKWIKVPDVLTLQKISDDDLVRTLVPRLSDEELDRLFFLISDLMRAHLSDSGVPRAVSQG